ncbi:MAG: HEPN domain-containing protein [candidate division WOR-3 bacterium]|nr:HEPN domain-containing protein [candidate division WOR-3 bacterium]
MTNKEEGQELIKQAERIFERDVENALKDRDYNLVIRPAQEAVELALKGALKVLGIEYPKIHDVGDIFAMKAKEKCTGIKDEICDRIREVSLWLSEAREPSFYFERKFTEEDATKARNDAGFVIKQIKKIFK